MAKNTAKSYRNQVMYSVYVRNHTPEGTFEGVRRDLERIKSLGTDVVWLMPVHPIGVKGHKGTLGCPYAIRDYRTVNPEYGTLEDFRRLVDAIHALGMKCIIDVVYNHTSPDSWLAQHHPEWFFHKPDGTLGGRVGDWSDVVDLDYSHPELWDYQIETLKYWATMVDGFRCDVASMVPVGFWLRARAEVETVRPGALWLAESVHPQFIAHTRSAGCSTASDCQLYEAFDVTYDYDVFPHFEGCLEGKLPLERYVELLSRQEIVYPANYVKLRFLENHDNLRAAFSIPDGRARRNWTAFQYFLRGMVLLYGGQEVSAVHVPSLFDKDPVDWSAGEDISPLLRALSEIKRDPLLAEGTLRMTAMPRDVVVASYTGEGRALHGVFSLRGETSLVEVDAPDGKWRELIRGGAVEVQMGRVSCTGEPIIFAVSL